jgi:hypothetical protein
MNLPVPRKKIWGISLLAVDLIVSQEGLWYMD